MHSAISDSMSEAEAPASPGGVETAKERSVTGALVLPGGVEAAAKGRSVTAAALEFRMRPVKDGLLSALALSCGFQALPGPNSATDDTAQKTSAAADGARPVRFGVALWSNIPADLPASSILVGELLPPLYCCIESYPLNLKLVVAPMPDCRRESAFKYMLIYAAFLRMHHLIRSSHLMVGHSNAI